MTAATTPVIEWELAYAEDTDGQAVTATTAATADTIATAPAIDLDGATVVLLHLFAPYAETPSGGGTMTFVLFDGSTQLAEFVLARVSGGSVERSQVNLWRRATPAAGSHTYSWRAYVSSGTGLVGAGPGGAGNAPPAFIRINRANPRVVA